MTRLLRFSWLIFVAVATSTCGDGTGAVAVDHILVTGRTPLRVSENVLFSAKAFDSRGQELSAQTFVWATTDTTVATVSASGLVTTVEPGQVTVSASTSGKAGTVVVTITLRPVTTVQVTPAVDSLIVGDSVQLVATLRDSTSSVVTGRTITWRSSDTTKATVTSTGLVRTHAAGGFAVVAQSEGQTGGAFLGAQYAVASLALPDTVGVKLRAPVQVIPDLRSSGGVHLAGRPVTWTIANPSIAQVSSVGLITPLALGTTVVSASCCGGLTDTGVLIVQDQPAFRVTVLLSSGSALIVSDSTPVQVELRDLRGVLVQRPVTWTSSDTAALHVVPDTMDSRLATLIARRPGPARIAASADGVRDSVFLALQLPISRLIVEPDTVVVRAGETAELHPTLQDSAGGVQFEPYSLAWTVVDSSVASVDGSITPSFVHGLTAGSTRATATALHQGITYTDSIDILVYPGSGTRLRWTPAATFAATFTTLNVIIAVRDSAGNPLSTGQNVTVVSQDTAVVTVTPALIAALTDTASVTLQPRRAGAVTVVARTDTLIAPIWVRVIDIGIGSLSIAPPAVIHPGDSILVSVTAVGLDNVPRPYPVTWTTSDVGIAIVTDSNVLVGVGLGVAQIVATSGPISDTAQVVVESVGGPSVDSLSPSRWLADSAVAIFGSNFDPNPSQDEVMVDGVPAAVTAATTSRLDLRLPPSSSFPCMSTHNATITVRTASGLISTTAILSTGHRRTLAIGESVRLLDAASTGCNELEQTGGAYEISVVTAPAITGPTTTYEFHGAGATAGPSPQLEIHAIHEPRKQARDSALWSAVSRDRLGLHRRILEASRALVQRVGPPAPLLRARPRPAASIADSIANLVRFRVPDVYRPDFCASYTAVTARRAFVGTHLDIYEDVTSQVAGRMDAAFTQVGQEFESVMYPELLANFGNPLALDSLLDRNGKIVVLVSPVVNLSAAGFVVSCDFYPESVAPSSNTGEILYVFAPTNSAGGFANGTVQYWLWLIRSVMMHESKHVTALAERLARGAPPEETWLEEGTAVIAEELWSRGIYGTAWKGNAGYQQTLFCDVRPTAGACAGRPFAMFNAFALLYDFSDGYAAPPGNEAHTPLGPIDPTDVTFYGSTWSLVRWTIDQYASTEEGFLKALIQDPVRTGIANLEARAGRGYVDLTSSWLLASVLDDQPGLTGITPEFTSPSWDLRSIYAGMNADFPSDFPLEFPYRARTVGFGAFTIPIQVLSRGTGSVFRIEGAQAARQMIALRALGGGPPPPGLVIEILRVQ